jgi:3-deoxy-manno-octulosonate cytidylyltransferase (CMP-KDO synthetase)
MNILGIIPARFASSRFPGKPLVIIDGKSMIQRVYEQAGKCHELSDVIIATDNEVIYKHVLEFGGKVMMTSPNHTSGTERCREVMEKLAAENDLSFDAVINIQGDEPYIDPGQISDVANCLMQQGVQIATLVKKIQSIEELSNENVVKVVFDTQSRALYFSRSPIPFLRGKDLTLWLAHHDYFKHIGIYGYRTEILVRITELPVSTLEKAESLEQLRWLEHNYEIRVQETDIESMAIDTPADLLKITNRS